MQAVKFWLIYKKDIEMDWYIPICIKLHQFLLIIKQNKVKIIKDFNYKSWHTPSSKCNAL